MDISLFDFELPEGCIALRPAEPRDAARLLVVRPAGTPQFEDRSVRDLPELLAPGDVVVVNDTRVIAARLSGHRLGRGETSPRIEATLIKRRDAATWDALARPARKLEVGDRLRFGGEGRVCLLGELDATVRAKGDAGEITLGFDFSGPVLDEAVAALGAVPLPPYIAGKRAADARDALDYQTVYAEVPGAVAAPTAGLHFTADLLARLAARGVEVRHVTLHVGAGTFLPVKAADTDAHKMHSEWGVLTADTAAALNAARGAGGRIVAVGTTALRVLETAAAEDGTLRPWSGDTDIFITPGYRFRAVDALLTNFHLPRSTLMMLVSAFSGRERMLTAYRHAVAGGYRFYSYGDASLLFPAGAA